MSPLSFSTPARLTSVATAKLPRLILLGLALAYIVAGLFMRDPWKTDDAVGLATMITAIREGGITWLLPQVGLLAHAEEGPLITWVGAICIWLFGPFIGDITAGRLPNLLWFGITAASVWYGTYLLGRRTEAQPLALPFGGEPEPRDYGRMLADAALLLLLATVGILQRTHETTVVPAIMACQALAFYSLARSVDRPFTGTTTLGIALAASFLTRGWVGAAPIMVGALLAFYPRSQLWKCKRWLPWAALVTVALILAWWIPASESSQYWIRNWKTWNLSSFALPSWHDVGRTLRDLPWYLWPTWPLALLAAWRWRAWIYAPHIWLPLMLLVCAAAVLFGLEEATDSEYVLLAVPCAVLGAFSLPTLRRGVVNTLDWFAVMCFSLTAATAWLGWVALHFNWPAQISRNIARQTTGYEPVISWGAFTLAVIFTVAWIALVVWRLRVRPQALWRGTVLSAGGLTVTWILLVLLWQPAVDYARSYRTVSGQLAQALAQHTRPGECVRGLSLGSGQRASFLIFNNLSFTFDAKCTLILQQTNNQSLRDNTAAYSDGASVLWQGGRRADRQEVFRLLRVGPNR
ncbi:MULTISPECIES: ArnT family glycosyltransferase [Achromobacter]|uniref:Glycosyltransferase n=1 Tax=Achromobacter spanius TaxID=217203 RepID=A0AAW3I2Z5_9BURK|nr:glycosyl transferase [Achromobacter spanius]AZS78409.1 glycosyltransferase [Achromobacter spanius]KNE26761.1 glycosyltransferase [Achromobacter spanius]MCD0496111.1 glycosyltransferase [Achromobacter sp. MY14]MCW3153129.1 glycosyltransferase [Achromobacter spanius]